jgi:hypothetical protein
MLKHQLKLSNKSTFIHLENLIDNIEQKYNNERIIDFIDKPCGIGKITQTETGIPLMLIGTQINKFPFDPIPQAPLSDTKFLKMITTIFHELEHYHQQTQTYRKENPSNDDVYITMREIATQKSHLAR